MRYARGLKSVHRSPIPFSKNLGLFLLGAPNGEVDCDMSKTIRDHYYVAWNQVDLRCENGVMVKNGRLP